MRRWIVLLSWLGLTGLAWSAPVPQLEGIQYDRVDGNVFIEIRFTDPVQYRSYSPLGQSNELRISVGVPSVSSGEPLAPVQQTLKAPEDPLIPLEQVSLNGDGVGGLVVRLQFSRAVRFDVMAGSGRNILRVLLPGLSERADAPDSALAAVSSALAAQAEPIARMMKEGRRALQQGEVPRAVTIFTKLVGLPLNQYSADALEMLGVARERNGQKAHAKAMYREYLKRFPSGPGAARVKQRLADLISGQMLPRPRLKAQKRVPEEGYSSRFYGSLAQYYYYGVNSVEGEASSLDESLLLNQLTLSWQMRSEDVEVRNFFYANQSFDFFSSVERPLTIETAYSQYVNKRLRLMSQIGRQSSSGGGVLGKFDGLKMGYDLSRKYRLVGQTGFPVDVTNKRSIQSNRPFVGMTLEIKGLDQGVDILPYFLHQRVDGITDRSAMGSEFRYFHPLGNFYSMLDYDVSYRALNIYLFRGQYNWRQQTSFNFSFDYRKNPLLYTSNALINQPLVNSISDLLNVFGEDEVRAMAKERAGNSMTVSAGVGHSFNANYQLRADITRAEQVYKIEDINSGDLVAEDDSQVYLFVQFIANQWVNARDTTVLGVRLSDTHSYNEVSLIASNRLPLSAFWRFDIRVRADIRSNVDSENLTKLRPSMKVDYVSNARLHFVAEWGYEWWRYSGNGLNPDFNRLFANIGYRWNF